MPLTHAQRSALYRQRHGKALLQREAERRPVEQIIAWQQANVEKCQAAQQRYRATPKGKRASRASAANHRARLREQFIENVDPDVVYERHGGMCGICFKLIDGDFHVDHIIPLSKGGPHCYANCQLAHPTCNLQKGATV